MATAAKPPNKTAKDEAADMFDDAATDGPPASTSSIIGGNNASTAADSHEKSIQQQLASNPPPHALPTGWFLKPSQIHAPGNYYYFNQDSGECCWELPATTYSSSSAGMASASSGTVAATTAVSEEEEAVSQESLNATAAAAAAAVESILNRADSTNENNSNNDATTAEPSRKKLKTDDKAKLKEKPSSASPKEVRVLHILKKHKGSRRPASWRNPNITDTKSKAIADLQELLSILSESKSNPQELRATFEELAKTESDCSSAKRGGDLGFFGRKKMQPAFEKASFGLNIGELSDVVDTSSGVHIILRLA